MAFTKQNKVSEVSPCLTYEHLHKDDKGEPIGFKFPMRRQKSGQADADRIAKSAGQLTDLDRFCNLLVSEPEGFGDFPNDARPISERAKEYFGDEDMDYFVTDALLAYEQIIYPRFFRAT
ncbi:MAG: hypothetical protein WBV94_05620 [Blastocatellia bacterium]